MSLGAIVGIASGLGALGSIFGAREQRKASDAAIAEQRAAREQARADLTPFRKAGTGILPDLTQLALSNPFDLPFERQEGFRDIQNSAAAGGKLQSGGTLAELAKFNAGLTARYQGQQFNQLFQLAQLGQNAAAGTGSATLQTGANISDLLTGKGNATAAGYIGAGNAISGGAQNFAFLSLLDKLGG